MRVELSPDYGERRNSLAQDWCVWLIRRGVKPILVPNGIPTPSSYLDLVGVRSLILSGGNDVVSISNNESNAPERDRTETELILAALQRGLPILGVCRGLHFLNRYFGGTVRTDLEGICGTSTAHAGTVHRVTMSRQFARLLNASDLQVNSFHNQGVTKQELAPNLIPFAASTADGLVEGFVHKDLPVLALQWHPERSIGESSKVDNLLFDRLINEGIFWGASEV